MIIKTFSLDDLRTYRLYYVLDDITDTTVSLHRRTPAGDELFEDADILVMQDGHLVVALKHPFKYSPNNCLIAKINGKEEIVNLICWERLVDFYDTPIDNTENGIFVFCDSVPIGIPGVEWRCDNTLYGAKSYLTNLGEAVSSLSRIISYENILSVHGVGYLTYVHLSDDEVPRELYKNNAEYPCAGFTLSEVFKVMLEWAETTKDPFNNTDEIALDARDFLEAFKFDPLLVDNQVDMQVANYLKGSLTARTRPDGIVENKPALINFIKKHMASSSFSELCLQYPGMWDTNEVLLVEQEFLAEGIESFNEYYSIPEGWTFDNPQRYVEHCEMYFNPTVGPYIHNQIRLFVNKTKVLNDISNR
jgi:hypothetical protein